MNYLQWGNTSCILACYSIFKRGRARERVCFDLSFSKSRIYEYMIFAGSEHVCDIIDMLSFDDEDIEKLGSASIGDAEFYEYLRGLEFDVDIFSLLDGTLVFAGEPIMKIKANIIESMLLESIIMSIVEVESTSATRAARIKRILGDRMLCLNDGKSDMSISRAAYIGGCDKVTHVGAVAHYGIPCVKVMPYSYVQAFDIEYSAFASFMRSVADTSVLCVDTYDTVASGMPSFLQAAEDFGTSDMYVGISSGDMSTSLRKIRELLDVGGFRRYGTAILAELDERDLLRLVSDGVPFDMFIMGKSESVTLKSDHRFCSIEEGGKQKPLIRIGDNYSKVSLPGEKKFIRYYDKNGYAVADEIMLADEALPTGKHTIFHPDETWKTKTLHNYDVREMLIKICEKGHIVYAAPSLEDTKRYCDQEVRSMLNTFLDDGDDEFPVDLSESLWTLRRRMMGQRRSSFFLR